MRSPLKHTETLPSQTLSQKGSSVDGSTGHVTPMTKVLLGKEQTVLGKKVLRRYEKKKNLSQSQGEVMAGWRGMREVNLSIFGS